MHNTNKNTHPVKSLIIDRFITNSSPLNRKDSSKLGLVIEGGGMRGVVSAGMLSALEHLNLLNCFDLVIGSSAGAVNGAYFLAGQSVRAVTSYYENINNEKFIRNTFKAITNLMLNKPALDLHYLYNQVIKHEKVLDSDKVLNSLIPLKVIVSSMKKRKAVVLDNFQTSRQLIDSLWAGTKIPIITGSPFKMNDDYYWDAFVYEAIPVKTALSQGCTHVFVLRSKPMADINTRLSFIEKNLICKMIAKRYGKIFEKDYHKSAIRYKYTINKLNKLNLKYQSSPFIQTINLLPETNVVNQMEKEYTRLVQGAKDGIKAVITNFQDVHPYLKNGWKKIILDKEILKIV